MSEVIAIDGPAGAGKTSVARGVADLLGWGHLDTGAYYRAATMAALIRGVDLANEAEVVLAVAAMDIGYHQGRTTLEGMDVEETIRGEKITALVSKVAALAGVRSLLVRRQREWVERAGGQGVVEGRDIGTKVFPQARLKVYLTAQPQVRAARRAGDMNVDVSSVLESMDRRDHVDSTRQASPLLLAEDAVEIDTSELTPAQTIDRVLQEAHRRGITRAG